MLPPDHVEAPLIVTLSVPARLPPLRTRVVAVMGFPVEKLAVPPLIVECADAGNRRRRKKIGEAAAGGGAAGDVISAGDIFGDRQRSTIVPAPVKGPFMANVPVPPADPKVNNAPELAAQDPLPVPPPLIFNWPTRAERDRCC